MDFTQALTYPFSDPDGLKKLAIAVGVTLLMGLVPVIGTIAGILLLAGWSYEITKRVKSGDPTPLPEWSDLGGLFSRGLQVTVPLIVYQLPASFFLCVGMLGFVLPSTGVIDDEMIGIGMAVTACCSCLWILVALVGSVLYWGGYIRYLEDEQMGTFFQFGETINLVQNNVGDFGMALLFVILGGFIGSILTGTFIGAILAPTLQNYYNAHILGQLARKLNAGEAPAAVPAV